MHCLAMSRNIKLPKDVRDFLKRNIVFPEVDAESGPPYSRRSTSDWKALTKSCQAACSPGFDNGFGWEDVQRYVKCAKRDKRKRDKQIANAFWDDIRNFTKLATSG